MNRCGTYHLPRHWYDYGWWMSQQILDKAEPPIQSFIGGKRGYYCDKCGALVVEGTEAWDKVMVFLEEERTRRRVREVQRAMEHVV